MNLTEQNGAHFEGSIQEAEGGFLATGRPALFTGATVHFGSAVYRNVATREDGTSWLIAAAHKQYFSGVYIPVEDLPPAQRTWIGAEEAVR